MKRNSIKTYIAALCLCAISVFTSCENIFEDIQQCPPAAQLRFLFDYNMEFANSFHKQVDCLTVYIYDKNDRLVATHTETAENLSDEAWRLPINLPAGTYTAVAYGGINCEQAAFAHNHPAPTSGHIRTDLRMLLNSSETSDQHLHDLYYGSATFDVSQPSPVTKEYTVSMIRDTNHFRIMLQHLSGEPVDGRDFTFNIVDDNTLFDHDNNILPNTVTTYLPWNSGSVNTSDSFDTRATLSDVSVGYAELSTSRLTAGRTSARLQVSDNNSGKTIIDIPLYQYLLMLKSERYSSMGAQEFLDRQSQWQMIFLLDENNAWVKTQIVINNWIVRLNSAELE